MRTISFLALAVRHWFLKHSSTSGLQCSGITETDAPRDEVETVSRSLKDELEGSGVVGNDSEVGVVGSATLDGATGSLS